MDGYGWITQFGQWICIEMDIKYFLAWIWMNQESLNILLMDVDGFGFYKPHPCQSLVQTQQLYYILNIVPKHDDD